MYFSTKLCFLQVIFYASEYLAEEMVADLVGFTLSEPAILEKLTGQQRSILQKFVDKLVSMFGNADAKAKEEYFDRFGGEFKAIFKDVAREADSIAEQFKAALDTSQKTEKNTVTGDGVRGSRDISEALAPSKGEVLEFSNAVDRWFSGKMKTSEHFKLGRTPIVLQKLGTKDLPVIMSQDVMVKMTGGKHSISLDEVKKLPEAIHDPIMVFDSATVPGTFVIVTELSDKSGNGLLELYERLLLGYRR